jgi:hypothetical protein
VHYIRRDALFYFTLSFVAGFGGVAGRSRFPGGGGGVIDPEGGRSTNNILLQGRLKI